MGVSKGGSAPPLPSRNPALAFFGPSRVPRKAHDQARTIPKLYGLADAVVVPDEHGQTLTFVPMAEALPKRPRT